MRLALTIALLIISITASGQSFRAQIIDSETEIPVSGASIQYDDTGIIADSTGWFTIEHPEYPIILTISHLSYHPRDFIIQSIQETGMIMQLIPKTLYRDAFNQIFLFANDSAYQVLYDGEKITSKFAKEKYGSYTNHA